MVQTMRGKCDRTGKCLRPHGAEVLFRNHSGTRQRIKVYKPDQTICDTWVRRHNEHMVTEAFHISDCQPVMAKYGYGFACVSVKDLQDL